MQQIRNRLSFCRQQTTELNQCELQTLNATDSVSRRCHPSVQGISESEIQGWSAVIRYAAKLGYIYPVFRLNKGILF